MTREEALLDCICIGRGCCEEECSSEQKELIKQIYDDFESRTCENCKHYKDKVIDYDDITYDGNCNNFISDVLYVEKDFGCNKFERKEDELQY